HVNVTDSAVRITHLPTNIVVSCQNERSQLQNKAKALQVLAAKLIDREKEEQRVAREVLAGSTSEMGWGNQIRSYFMAPYQLVKDLRTLTETGNVDSVMNGEISFFMESYLRWSKARS
ncbi:peptide chain release factor RF-2, partial [mine drainage metagenome]